MSNRLRLTGHRAAVARDTIGVREAKCRIESSKLRPSELYRILCVFDPAAIAYWTKADPSESVAQALNLYSSKLKFVRASLSGEQLLQMGVPRSPVMGDILEKLRDSRLNGEISSEDEERALAQSLLLLNLDGAANQQR